MLKNLMFVTIYVSDQDRALAFYTERLGLEKCADNPGPEGRFLTVAPSDESVQIVLWPGSPGQGPAVDPAPGPVFLESDDLRKEFDVLRSRGVDFVQPEPEDYPFGVRVTALDPDGNRIELRQPKRSRRSDGEPTSDLRAIADRVEIEALRGEFTDAAMMRDYDRLASLFTPDGALRMPNIPTELAGQHAIRAFGKRVPDLLDFFVQNTHPGTIELDGDTASGRAYMHELGRARDGRSGLNYAIYHDRYQRTPDGWKFTERVYEVRYEDMTPLAGSPPPAAGAPVTRGVA